MPARRSSRFATPRAQRAAARELRTTTTISKKRAAKKAARRVPRLGGRARGAAGADKTNTDKTSSGEAKSETETTIQAFARHFPNSDLNITGNGESTRILSKWRVVAGGDPNRGLIPVVVKTLTGGTFKYDVEGRVRLRKVIKQLCADFKKPRDMIDIVLADIKPHEDSLMEGLNIYYREKKGVDTPLTFHVLLRLGGPVTALKLRPIFGYQGDISHHTCDERDFKSFVRYHQSTRRDADAQQ